MTHSREKTVILDRDGTIIHDKHYLACPDGVSLLPFAVEGLRLLQRQHMRLFVSTNQSGIGRGYFTLTQMYAVNARLEALLEGFGIRLHGIFHCPHAPDTPCQCRKPNTGMIEQIREQYSINADNGFVIGDKHCDIALGHNAHMRSILVRTGYGAREEHRYQNIEDASRQKRPHHIADNLLDAAQWIVRQ